MKIYHLDPNVLLGGIIAEDQDQQVVHLNLQKGNEMPPYDIEAIVNMVVLSGRAQLTTAAGSAEITPLQVVRLEPKEQHTLIALEDNTVIVAIKQLCYEMAINKKLRFGNCCL